jgi:CheY-like chemotaxis protein
VAPWLTKPFDRDELLAALEKHRSAKTRCRILVIDDDPDVREIMIVTLGAADCAVVSAENGAEGLKCLDDSLPDVILLDLVMPKMDGFEFMARLQEKEAWRDIPVVVVTAKVMTPKDTKRLEGLIEKLTQKGDHLDALFATLDGMFPRQTDAAKSGTSP